MLKDISDKEWAVIVQMRRCLNYDLHLKTYDETLEQWKSCIAMINFDKFLLSCGAINVNIDYTKEHLRNLQASLIQLGKELDYLRKNNY